MWQSVHDTWWRLACLPDRQATQSHPPPHQGRWCGSPQFFSDALAVRALSVGSLAYRAAVAVRNTAYDQGWVRQVRLPCRVVSVGNLTVGGTGKTACVALIAAKVAALGKYAAILSRGYGGARRGYWLLREGERVVVDGEPQAVGNGLADEPQLLARHLNGVPIVVGPSRVRTGRLAHATFGVDTLILDDGFQHRQVARDCDVVLVHARMPLDGWALFPRGPMREPLRALRRADVIIITKADEALEKLGALSERLRALNPRAVLASATHEPSGLLDGATGALRDSKQLSGMRVALVSSIGDPEGFEATVRRLHATVLSHRVFPDHHRYTAADWTSTLAEAQKAHPDAVVTTEKDWVRLQPWTANRGSWTMPLWVLRVQMKILQGEEELDARLARVYAR